MKKLLATLISLSVMAGSAFARVMYNGDVQLHIGTGMDSFYIENESTTDVKSNTFDFDVSSWHLFSLNDLFSAGFMVDFNGGVGATKDITKSGSLCLNQILHCTLTDLSDLLLVLLSGIFLHLIFQQVLPLVQQDLTMKFQRVNQLNTHHFQQVE